MAPATFVERLVIEFIVGATLYHVRVGLFGVLIVAIGKQHFTAAELGFKGPFTVRVLADQSVQTGLGLLQVAIHGIGFRQQVIGFGPLVGIVGTIEQLLIQGNGGVVVHIMVRQ